MKSEIELVQTLRKENKGEEAYRILTELLKSHPDDPEVNYEMAWTCDSMGNEAEAAPYYEVALANGLKTDREGAWLGLGSTYRCLGEYEKSHQTLSKAITEFPKNRALKVFQALTLFNLGRSKESVSTLLIQLLETTNDPEIKSYERALLFYSDKLDEVWK